MAETVIAEATTTEAAPDLGSLLDAGATTDKTKAAPDASKDAATAPDSKAAPDPLKADGIKPNEKPAGAPEKYADPKLPEGLVLDPDVKSKFDADAKAMNLTQEQYQTIIDRQSELTQKQIKTTMDVFNAQIKEWRDASIKELGADYEKSLAVAAKGIDAAFSDPKDRAAFREILKDSGLGNMPLMIRFASFAGNLVGEDTFVNGKPVVKSKSTAEIIFDHPSSQHEK